MEFEVRHGWSASMTTAPLREPEETRHPVLRLQKGELWAETHGERGIDPSIMYERALIEALRYELSLAGEGPEADTIRAALNRAVTEERVSQQMRREAAEAAAAEEI